MCGKYVCGQRIATVGCALNFGWGLSYLSLKLPLLYLQLPLSSQSSFGGVFRDWMEKSSKWTSKDCLPGAAVTMPILTGTSSGK
jgi:hypothetical protein